MPQMRTISSVASSGCGMGCVQALCADFTASLLNADDGACPLPILESAPRPGLGVHPASPLVWVTSCRALSDLLLDCTPYIINSCTLQTHRGCVCSPPFDLGETHPPLPRSATLGLIGGFPRCGPKGSFLSSAGVAGGTHAQPTNRRGPDSGHLREQVGNELVGRGGKLCWGPTWFLRLGGC